MEEIPAVMKRLAAIFAALALVLLVAAPAAAQDLHQTPPIPWNSTQVEQSCSQDELDQLAEGQVLWHFVGHFSTDVGVTMSATFEDGTTFTNEPYDSHNGVPGNWELDWNLITEQTTLLSASVNTTTSTDGFNLSHICAPPTTEIPEAPFSALLVLSVGVSLLGYFGLRMRQARSVA
jgi:hypothetical protein